MALRCSLPYSFPFFTKNMFNHLVKLCLVGNIVPDKTGPLMMILVLVDNNVLGFLSPIAAVIIILLGTLKCLCLILFRTKSVCV